MGVRERCRKPKLWIPLILLGLIMVHSSSSDVNICKFCHCMPNEALICNRVLGKGYRLKHAIEYGSFPGVNNDTTLSELTPEVLQGFESIRTLDLMNNGLFRLNSALFMTLNHLQRVILSFNHFEDFPDFQGLESLIILLLDFNNVRKLPENLPRSAPNIQELDLKNNRIEAILGSQL